MAAALLKLWVLSQILCAAATQLCLDKGETSIFGMMLRQHIFKKITGASLGDVCLRECYCDVRCQSFNYVFTQNLCELSNRTKEARPEDFVPNFERYYFRRDKNRVPLGSIPEMPAESCMEIISSEEGKAESGVYWLNIKELGIIQVYCDFTQGKQSWILIARFSNKDGKHWMNDSGYWWYDRTEAIGKTADPSNNADMISPTFWLVNGSEFKITRNDDFLHTPLLQTTGNCLGGQTFRSKVTSHGDFRNGTVWESDSCLGKCTVQYGGQYQTTEGFTQAGCNGSMQAANKIGFWCERGWTGSVIMIGGGGGNCNQAAHGIGVTAAKQASFKIRIKGRPEYDFGNNGWGSHTRDYALNLWIR